jgi:flagellar biosynthesis/type III secretory pathway chaperone
MWDNLISLMAEIVAVYRLILEVSRKKKQALISARVEELEVLIKQEENLILQIGKKEAVRRKIAVDLASVYALPPEEFNLAKAKELGGAEVAAKLQALEDELASIISDLTPLNKTNSELIQQSLNYVNYSLNLLTQNSAGTNYAERGTNRSASRPKALIDAKV